MKDLFETENSSFKCFKILNFTNGINWIGRHIFKILLMVHTQKGIHPYLYTIYSTLTIKINCILYFKGVEFENLSFWVNLPKLGLGLFSDTLLH